MNDSLRFTNNGVEIAIPYTPHSFKYWHYACARSAELKVRDVDTEGLDEEQKTVLEFNAMATFCDWALELPDGVSCADIMPLHSTNDLLPTTDLYSICISSRTEVKDLSLIKVYYHLNSMCEQYSNEALEGAKLGHDLKFSYKGDTYKIKGTDGIDKALTANELIQSLEIKRLGQPQMTEGKRDKDGNEIAGEQLVQDFDVTKHHFTLMRTLAVLARKKGEVLETNPLLIERFIERRAEYFKDLPFTAIKDIDFFLTAIVMNYHKLGSIISSSQARQKQKAGRAKHRAHTKGVLTVVPK